MLGRGGSEERRSGKKDARCRRRPVSRAGTGARPTEGRSGPIGTALSRPAGFAAVGRGYGGPRALAPFLFGCALLSLSLPPSPHPHQKPIIHPPSLLHRVPPPSPSPSNQSLPVPLRPPAASIGALAAADPALSVLPFPSFLLPTQMVKSCALLAGAPADLGPMSPLPRGPKGSCGRNPVPGPVSRAARAQGARRRPPARGPPPPSASVFFRTPAAVSGRGGQERRKERKNVRAVSPDPHEPSRTHHHTHTTGNPPLLVPFRRFPTHQQHPCFHEQIKPAAADDNDNGGRPLSLSVPQSPSQLFSVCQITSLVRPACSAGCHARRRSRTGPRRARPLSAGAGARSRAHSFFPLSAAPVAHLLFSPRPRLFQLLRRSSHFAAFFWRERERQRERETERGR